VHSRLIFGGNQEQKHRPWDRDIGTTKLLNKTRKQLSILRGPCSDQQICCMDSFFHSFSKMPICKINAILEAINKKLFIISIACILSGQTNHLDKLALARKFKIFIITALLAYVYLTMSMSIKHVSAIQ